VIVCYSNCITIITQNRDPARRFRFLKLGERSIVLPSRFTPMTVSSVAGPTSLHQSGAVSISQGAISLSQYGFLPFNILKSLRTPWPIRQLKTSTVLAATAHKIGSFPSFSRGSGMSLMCHPSPKRKWSGLEAPISPRDQNFLISLFRRSEAVGRLHTYWTMRRKAAAGVSIRSARKRENLMSESW